MRSVRCPTVARHERATRWTYGGRAHLPEAVRRLGVRLDVLLEGPSDDYAPPVGMAQRTGVLCNRSQGRFLIFPFALPRTGAFSTEVFGARAATQHADTGRT